MSDNELIKEILDGDRDKYRFIVEKYQSMIFRTVMGFLHDKDEADDVTQEIFINTYQSLAKFKGDALFSTWIYRIAVNASLNKVRKASKSLRIQALLGMDKLKPLEIPETENPENIIIREEHHQWIKHALNSLPESQRIAIVLSKYDDLPQKKIAEIMNISEGAVEALIQRAKANLRKKLSISGKQP